MAALGAVKSGAGLVTVATDKENIPALHSHLPEAMAFDLGDKPIYWSNSFRRLILSWSDLD